MERSIRTLRLILVGLLAIMGLLVLVACGPQSATSENHGVETTNATAQPESEEQEQPQENTSLGLDQLVERLRNDGATVEVDRSNPETTLFPVPGYTVRINGEKITVYEFVDAGTTVQEANNVKPDGTATSRKEGLTWEQPSHFYQKGRLIVVYAGSNEPTLKLLQNELGIQFAGQFEDDDPVRCMDNRAGCGGVDK